MKAYEIEEVIHRYHRVEIDDEADIETLTNMAQTIIRRCGDGVTALDTALKLSGFDYKIAEEYCGAECTALNLVDEI